MNGNGNLKMEIYIFMNVQNVGCELGVGHNTPTTSPTLSPLSTIYV